MTYYLQFYIAGNIKRRSIAGSVTATLVLLSLLLLVFLLKLRCRSELS